MTSTRLRRGIAAAALLVGLALSGCGAHPGAAAVVDGQQITEEELAQAITDFTAVTGQQVDPATMLATLVVAPTILEVGAQYDVAASDDEATALLDLQAEAGGLAVPDEEYGQGVIQVAKVTIVNQGLSAAPDPMMIQQQIGEQIAQADVEVSPRYGEFDGGQIVAQPLPWIATPTP